MSHTYNLICIDHGRVLNLGKIAEIDRSGHSIPQQLTGFLDQKDGHRIQGVELWKFVERFLIVHRGCELRVVPEDFLLQVDPEGKLSFVESEKELLEREIYPESYDSGDAASPLSSVAERIMTVIKDKPSLF